MKALESVAERIAPQREGSTAARSAWTTGGDGDWQADGDSGWVMTVNTPTTRWFVFLCCQQWVGSAA